MDDWRSLIVAMVCSSWDDARIVVVERLKKILLAAQCLRRATPQCCSVLPEAILANYRKPLITVTLPVTMFRTAKDTGDTDADATQGHSFTTMVNGNFSTKTIAQN